MISARLRYTAMSLLALAALITGLAQLLDRAWPGAVLGLALTVELLLGCRMDPAHRRAPPGRAAPRA